MSHTVAGILVGAACVLLRMYRRGRIEPYVGFLRDPRATLLGGAAGAAVLALAFSDGGPGPGSVVVAALWFLLVGTTVHRLRTRASRVHPRDKAV